MDRAKYSSCIGAGMQGKQFTPSQRKTEFCILAKMCSGKAKTREEAGRICAIPKPPKAPRPEGEKRHRRVKQQECPEFDATQLIPHCEGKLQALVRSGELPANSDINGFCRLILE